MLLEEQRPALVIAPPAPHVQIARRVPFTPEAEAPYEPDRRAIAGLDVRFEAVETQPPKRVIDHQREARGHQTPALRRLKRIVAKVAAAERAADDLADVNNADERAGVA